MKLDSRGALMPVGGFSRHPNHRLPAGQSAYRSHDGLLVVSSREDAYLPGSGFVEYDPDAGPVHRAPPLVGPQWLVSVSLAGRGRDRPGDADVARVVEAFAMPAFDEDNHHPGLARHLWCPVEEQYRNACECKLTEVIVTDVDGYRWTDQDGPCRGCEYERIFNFPCPLHAPTKSER